MQLRVVKLIAAVVMMTVCSACGRGAPGPLLAPPQPVQGKIAFADHSPLRGGVVYFTPLDVNEGGPLRYEAAGLVDAKGQYKLGFNGDNKGVPAGEYKVTIMPRDYQEIPNSNSKLIPSKYQQQKTTPLTTTVKEGDSVLDFELIK
jgi:hypothetical protein